MIVMAMRHQHDVDRRQVRECDARVVDALWPDKAERGCTLRPYRIEQNVESRGLDQPAGMADIADAPNRAFDMRRRPVSIERRRPCRPLRSAAAPVAIDH